ncbi:hypothetical protein [Rhodanobacter sp. DHG33]|uniref:hypothetical protein n=1 Tax=Rhodanobacter sp. DHG33 TaxID=2775921 RepID=UPI001780BBCC|nr:hypothetical protein [Rhodanobacter sp. DHG33]MBD8898466.1 hypothetical protein [Rhodanobacter sp. DHG33]
MATAVSLRDYTQLDQLTHSLLPPGMLRALLASGSDVLAIDYTDDTGTSLAGIIVYHAVQGVSIQVKDKFHRRGIATAAVKQFCSLRKARGDKTLTAKGMVGAAGYALILSLGGVPVGEPQRLNETQFEQEFVINL